MSEPWYKRWFNEDYQLVYAHRDVAASREEAAFALSRLGARPDSSILDLCCGMGRHMVAILELGFRSLVGLDLSVELLDSARESILSCWPEVPMVRGDMLALPFSDRCFGYVVNFFTSFGYFETEEENAKVLSEAGRVLRPGGRLWLDYLNPTHVKKTLVPESVREVEEITVREKRTLSEDETRLRKTIELTRQGETRAYVESVRLYDREELESMLSSAGLNVIQAFGDYEPVEISDESPRMILVGEKSRENRRRGRQ